MTKVLVYGIDGAPPELIFEKWLDELPSIKGLMNKGVYAKINSTIPPATIIAWSAFASGKDASQIGVFSYTFRDRKTGMSDLVNSSYVKTDMIWDILSGHSRRCVVLNVPLTYPVKPVNGIMVSGFMAPDVSLKSVYPESVIKKIKSLGNPELFFDVAGFTGHKGLDIDELLRRTYLMTDMQVALLKDLIVNEEWDFLMQVFIGTDRLQHMLWRHFDNTHRRFIKDSKYKDALKDYYKYLDKKLGEVLKLLKQLDNDIVVIVSSDHGMVKQEGKININDWLMNKGYLVLTDEFRKEIEDNNKQGKRTKIKYEGIDLDKSAAYGAGAYNARIFINKGKVGQAGTKEYEDVRKKIIKGLKQITDDKGKKLKTEVFKAEDIYADTSSPECPDLTVYFDELRWASNPDFGVQELYSWQTAVGADSAGHSKQGSFVMAGLGVKAKGKIKDIDIYQVAPTILKLMNIPVPKDIKHKPIEMN
ncbi:alkaline phosphatase family protein [Candidatus Woesearchaeota archaeon]|nr:alkaline phosphatase family protein [Candidatus Woesearchaeota archaeon]